MNKKRKPMNRIYSYVLRYDDGAAPNPFWGKCTLTICKPAIRRTAQIGDWVIGTGSKNSKLNDGKRYDLSDSIVYAMKISQVLTMEEYDIFCEEELNEKVPDWNNKDWRRRMGDCIYDYSESNKPKIRKGVHNEGSRIRDLSGKNSLISNHFYYFGEEARPIPEGLKKLIKKNQGHLKIENIELIKAFEEWVEGFEKNTRVVLL
jgi:putative DNA base modification enzyme with NMAD domain